MTSILRYVYHAADMTAHFDEYIKC